MSRYVVTTTWGDTVGSSDDLRTAAGIYVDALGRRVQALAIWDNDTGEAVDDDAVWDALDGQVAS